MNKTAKRILTGIVIFLVIFLGIAALLPGGYTVTRETTMRTTPENIFSLAGDLNNWEKWSVWREMDKDAKFTFPGKTTGAGAQMMWEGDTIGTGELTFVQYRPDELIMYEFVFKKPFRAKSTGTISLESNDSGMVKVTWTDKGSFAWPVMRWFGLFLNMENKLGPNFEKNLEHIKMLAEAMPIEILPKINPQVKYMKPVTLAGIRFKCPLHEIGERIGESYGRIGMYLGKNKIMPDSVPPIVIYHEYNETETEMEPALVVPEGTPGEGDIVVHPSYSGQAMVVQYYGDYAKMGPTYKAMEKWMKRNHHEKNGAPWESYVTDPMMEADTAKWLTEIYWPIK